MDFFEAINRYKTGAKDPDDALVLLENELGEGLALYWDTAGRILKGSGTRLQDAPEGFYALENNFFSALFLYSYHRAGIPANRRILYAAVNQCIRGMVTGCDNILDDEYKKTLETDLPAAGTRFRSVLDIMVSDRVLVDILAQAMPAGRREQILDASAISLRALVRSGAQEAGEQAGVEQILPPEELLAMVHHFKTGILFQSPWAIPMFLETLPQEAVSPMNRALYDIGLGCQIIDDVVDLPADLEKHRHNYIVSLIHHNLGDAARKRLQSIAESGTISGSGEAILSDFPEAKAIAAEKARQFLETGLSTLFAPRHRFLVAPAMSFLEQRIGAVLFKR